MDQLGIKLYLYNKILNSLNLSLDMDIVLKVITTISSLISLNWYNHYLKKIDCFDLILYIINLVLLIFN